MPAPITAADLPWPGRGSVASSSGIAGEAVTTRPYRIVHRPTGLLRRSAGPPAVILYIVDILQIHEASGRTPPRALPVAHGFPERTRPALDCYSMIWLIINRS